MPDITENTKLTRDQARDQANTAVRNAEKIEINANPPVMPGDTRSITPHRI
jgi:hypothetical protein